MKRMGMSRGVGFVLLAAAILVTGPRSRAAVPPVATLAFRPSHAPAASPILATNTIPAASAAAFQRDVRPVLDLCSHCHNPTSAAAGLNIAQYLRAGVAHDRTRRVGAHSGEIARRRNAAALRRARARRRDGRAHRLRPGRVGSAGRGADTRSRPRAGPPPEPRRVREHRARSARRGLPRDGRLSARRFRLRIRQQRRRPHGLARADGKIPVGGRGDCAAGRRRRRAATPGLLHAGAIGFVMSPTTSSRSRTRCSTTPTISCASTSAGIAARPMRR